MTTTWPSYFAWTPGFPPPSHGQDPIDQGDSTQFPADEEGDQIFFIGPPPSESFVVEPIEVWDPHGGSVTQTNISYTRPGFISDGLVSPEAPETVDYSSSDFYTFMDEFGSVAKEVRKINVEYDLKPALSAYIFLSNEDSIDALRHHTDSFSSEFLLFNRERNLGVVNGEDTHEVDGETVTQQIIVYGLVVKREDEQSVERENEQSIRVRGIQELDFNSPWIQREEQVEEIADFVVQRWSEPADVFDISITPNPALTTGDVVSTDYPSKGMSASTHIYHIISINMRYDAEEGLSQDLKLRRFRS